MLRGCATLFTCNHGRCLSCGAVSLNPWLYFSTARELVKVLSTRKVPAILSLQMCLLYA
jgi:hypothetical protein